MSTHIHEYLVYGTTLENDALNTFTDWWNGLSRQEQNKRKDAGNLLVLFDNTDGEYALIGRGLAISEDDDPLGQGQPVPIPLPDGGETLRIAKAIRDQLGIQQPLALHFVAHYH